MVEGLGFRVSGGFSRGFLRIAVFFFQESLGISGISGVPVCLSRNFSEIFWFWVMGLMTSSLIDPLPCGKNPLVNRTCGIAKSLEVFLRVPYSNFRKTNLQTPMKARFSCSARDEWEHPYMINMETTFSYEVISPMLRKQLSREFVRVSASHSVPLRPHEK